MEALQTETKAPKKAAPAGMAWISGRQKPFYSPRVIKKGRNKGNLEVRYLKAHGHFKTVIIKLADITKALPPWDIYLRQQEPIFKET